MQGQILNDITQAYANTSVDWLNVLLPMAEKLFVTLATIELAWSGIWWAMAARKGENLIGNILKKLFTIMFLYTIVLFGRSWIPFIISGFIEAGSQASGFRSLNPSNVLEHGISVSILLSSNASQAFSWWQMPLWAYMAPVVLILAFSLIAGMLVVTLIEAYIVIGGGILLLGFAGSRWTATFAEGYLLYAFKVGLRLFVIYLLIGIGMSLPAQWVEILGRVNPGDPRYFFEVMGGALILAMIVWRVPMFASQMIHHRATFHLDSAYRDLDG